MNRRVVLFQKCITLPFLALKMAVVVHTGPGLETKTSHQKRAELSDQTVENKQTISGQKFLNPPIVKGSTRIER